MRVYDLERDRLEQSWLTVLALAAKRDVDIEVTDYNGYYGLVFFTRQREVL